MNQMSIDCNCNVLIYTCISDLPTNYDKISTSYLMNKYIQLLLINDNTDLGNDLDF